MPELLFCLEVEEEGSGGVFRGALSASCISFIDFFFFLLNFASYFPLTLA